MRTISSSSTLGVQIKGHAPINTCAFACKRLFLSLRGLHRRRLLRLRCVVTRVATATAGMQVRTRTQEPRPILAIATDAGKLVISRIARVAPPSETTDGRLMTVATGTSVLSAHRLLLRHHRHHHHRLRHRHLSRKDCAASTIAPESPSTPKTLCATMVGLALSMVSAVHAGAIAPIAAHATSLLVGSARWGRPRRHHLHRHRRRLLRKACTA